jgi:hypothetical protein
MRPWNNTKQKEQTSTRPWKRAEPKQTPQIVKQRSLTPDEIKKSEKEKDKLTIKRVWNALTDKDVQQATRQPIWDLTSKAQKFTDVQGAEMRKYAFGDVNYEATGNVKPTTGNETADAIAGTAGMISSAFLPSGGGAPSMAAPVRNAAEFVANKIVPKVGNAVGKVANVALRGSLESLPYTAQQLFVGDKKSIKEMAKTAGNNLVFGVVTELGIEGAGELFKVIGNKMKKGVTLSAKEKAIVDEVSSPAAIVDDAEKELQDAITTPNPKQSERIAEELRNAEPIRKAAGIEETPIAKPTQTVQPRIETEQVNVPLTDNVAQKGVQSVDNVIEFKPKTPNQKKYVEQVTAKLPNDADGLNKKIAELETAKSVEKDGHKLLKINLQLFAAKEKLKTFTDIPRGNLPDGEVERGLSKNIRTDKSMPDEIRESFDENPLGHKQKTNEETLAKAETIMAKGQAEALSEYYTLINGKKYSAEAVPLAKLIAKNAQAAGDIATARQILSDAAVKLTEAGQFSQAAKILRESDPETFLITVQKQLNKLNKEGSKFYKKKWNKLDLTDDEIARIGKIKKGDNAAYESMMEEIHNRIALDVPSNAWEKFDSWRRMAMLMNPTTHIRNIVGNTIMGGMQKTSDSVAAILERAFVPQAEQTKSILWRTDKTRVATVGKAWEANKKQLMKGGRWDLESGVGTLKELNSIKPVFKTKLEVANKLSKDLLNAEDNIFVKAVWENSLGSYMKARNINEVTDEAVEYATRRAYEATFKQANLLSTTINKIKNVPVVGRLAEGAIPFSKTPSNIAMRAVEYSPIGIMKALYSGVAKKGAAAVIEDFSKAATGTGIAAIGYTLAATGWARGKTSTSAKVEALRSKQGEQANSITTPLGSYTVDWAQPFAIPFFMGVAMYEELQNPKYDGKLSEAILNSIYKGGDTLFEMTMLRNIKQILGYGSTTEKIGATMLSYIEQAIPSLLGKIARSIDPKSRETYDPNPAKEEWNKVVAKVPWLSAILPEKIDNFGEVIKNSSALEQFLSPGYTKGKDTRTFMKELERLYEVEKDTDIIPSVTTGKISDNSIDYVMTADEYTRFKKTYGSNIMNGYTGSDGIKRLGLNALIESPEYKKIKSDKDKFKRITKLYSKAYELAKSEFLKGRGVK